MSWVEKTVEQNKIDALIAKGQAPLMARILALRGITPVLLDSYLNPSMSNLAAPSSLPGIDDAVDAIITALRLGNKAVVFGDYDCDGISATAILVKTLRALSFNVAAFLPNRKDEGYGMNAKSVQRLLQEHSDVGIVITVDNGINSVEEVALLKSRGITVVVTDHHLPGDILPDCPVVNPKVSAPESLEHLCGAGVAFFLSNALMRRAREEGLYSRGKISPPLFVLAGLATVTDIMPLNIQNRILVSEALKLFNQYAPIGLKKLYEGSQQYKTPSPITSRNFGFTLGPRINASGRMSDGMEALKLLLQDDSNEADQLAAKVNELNGNRKDEEQIMFEEALKQVVIGAPAQIIELNNGNKGIVGIVASRILERLDKLGKPLVPVAVIVDAHGSLRAPEGYNVRDALVASQEVLLSFGGHALAGGFSVRKGCMAQFKELFLNACSKQSTSNGNEDGGHEYIDSWVMPESLLTADFANSLSKMEPFGEGNPEPVLALRNVKISDIRTMGKDGQHLTFSVDAQLPLRCVWWRNGEKGDELKDSSCTYDIKFVPEVSSYGGKNSLQLRILSMK